MALAAKSFSDLITFTRASTAGYYGSDGLYKTAASGVARTGTYADYKPAEITQQNILTYSSDYSNAAWTKDAGFVQTNLLTYSEQLDNAAWLLSEATISPNAATAPDGTLTADKLIPSTTPAVVHTIRQSVTATGGAFSIYAKAAGETTFSLWFVAAGQGVLFDLSAGSTTTISGGITSSITSVGNGWYRCTGVFTGATTLATIYVRNGSGFAGDGVSGIYLWGAQLVQGSVAGDYRATTSSALPILYADPLGTTLAQKFCETSSTATVHRFYQQINGVSGTAAYASIYAKAGERTRIEVVETTNGGGVFDLSTGTRVSGSGEITPVGSGGWYRISLLTSFPSSNIVIQVRLYSNSTSNYAGDGTSGVYLFGEQLNIGSTLLPYLATTATGGHATTTGAKRGFLVEESRTNLLLRSNDWSATWANTNLTVTANAAGIVAPDGTVTATKLAATTSATTNCYQAVVATSTSLVYSIFAKQGSGAQDANRFTVYNITTGSTVGALTIDYSTGVLTQTTGTGATSEPIGNGWWRIAIPANSGITIGNTIGVYAGYAGGPETAGEYAYFWGAQLEVGAFATSYIPTTTAQVTRATDVASVNTLSPWFNSAAGTIYAEATRINSNAPAGVAIEIGDGTSNNRYMIFAGSPFPDAFYIVTTGGVSQASIGVVNGFSTNTIGKVAAAYALNDFQQATNATLGTADTSGTLPSVTTAFIGRNSSGTQLNGWLRSIRYYPRRLTNAELQALTA